MKLVALISGGKDSCYNMMQCVAEGHEIVALANLKPKDKDQDELDSYMYQTVGHHAVALYAEAMGLPLYRRSIEGSPVTQGRDYQLTDNDEVEDLYQLLKEVKEEMGIEGVSVGAILSDYQRVRVEHVCQRLCLTAFAYLWRRNQQELLNEMIECGVKAILIKVAALGLQPSQHLGQTLSQIYPHMLQMKQKYGLNECGEGGEYETFTLDCPLFNKAIVLDSSETVVHSADAFAPVAYLNLTRLHLEDKPHLWQGGPYGSLQERMRALPMKHSGQLMAELFNNEKEEVEEERLLPVAVDAPSDLEEDVCRECQKNRMEGGFIRCRKGYRGWTMVTGLVAKDDEGQDIQMQTTRVLNQLQEQLTCQGLHMRDLVAVHLYVRNMADFALINAAYKMAFASNPPVRICVQASLPPNVSVQIDAVALDPQAVPDPLDRLTMHVQGVSHWGPANIGPYSQAVRVGDRVYIAGQIALCPATMELVPGGMLPQARLSLRHVRRVLAAVAPGSTLADVVAPVCYVTHRRHVATAQREWSAALATSVQGEVDRVCPADDDGEIKDQMLECVVVPGLPRGSLVEWHVRAEVNSDGTMSGIKTGLCGKGSLRAGLQYRHSERVLRCRIQISEGQEEPAESRAVDRSAESQKEDGSVAADDAMKLLLKSLKYLCSATNTQLHHLDLLRVFYRTDVFQADEMHQAFVQISSSSGALEAAVLSGSLVPVQGLGSPQTILSACC